MKIDRTRNTSRNVIFGAILKLYQIIMPFIVRTAMIYILGMDYVGLNTLFNSILQVLNLTELGVGSAMVFSMYKPIAEDDKDTICKLMRLYKIYYRVIGVIIAVVGLLITPVVPNLISDTSIVSLNIYYLYWMNLGYTVLSYWLFAYKGSLLQAHQRTDVVSKVTLATNTFMYMAQLALLFIFKNYYLYLLCLLLGQATTNIVTAVVVDRMYPEYKASGKLAESQVKEINQRVKDLFTAKIGGVIQNSADSIVISAFLGLTLLARYNNYYYIMNSVFGFICLIFSSAMAGVGNSLILESEEKNYQDLKKITFLSEWIAGFCSCCLLCLYQPFMKLWVGEENTLPFGVVVCFSVYLTVVVTNQMLCLYKDAAGVWHADRWRPLITAMTNLCLNLATVNFLGLYGVVLSTVISMLVVGMPWLISNLFKTIFHREKSEYIKRLLSYVAVSGITCTVTYFACNLINDNGLGSFIIKICICCILPNIIFFSVFSHFKEFGNAMNLADRMTGNKLRKIPFMRKYIV